ncbi:class III extradiol dioxygenase subunit B-like domain-containing protein [Streptomyces kunmingensis]|uniref:Class III extradiol dioxygenase subunit B-like domain-containing protein n=1 Tax=Streptomyces kunmingensis TaxID=68225 RepID=A0ABU6CAQ5_9ACTN|nr:class III extradiol dioxygenase subunit B-like domain-containing protein [Streptomyces kunmingensis]MEB3961738.1 class III extradiol dioxygenase subunit B-like domain-containing protein [Streptomyces kunmingensis]
MLVAAAVCPCPPLLVPEVAAGAAPELDAAREACDEAIGAVLAAGPDLVWVIGQGPRPGVHRPGARGSFRPFGVDLDVYLGAPDESADVTLAPSLAVGAWLLTRAGWTGETRGHEVAPDDSAFAGADGAWRLGEGRTGKERVGFLVMGDGTACRTVKAPGYLDERADGVDSRIAESLRTLDRDGYLAQLDAGLAAELKISGRAPWQLLSAAWSQDHGDDGTGRLLYEDAPYGVGYFVASWT